MATQIWINIGSGNGLLPDGTKPLPEPMLTSHWCRSVTVTWEQFCSKCPRYYSVWWVWKIYFLKLLSYFLGVNELNISWLDPEYSWWRHQMEIFSAMLFLCAGNSPVTGEFPTQRPVTRNFDVFFDLRLNKRLSKQSWGWWSETPSCSLWRQCNVPGEPRRPLTANKRYNYDLPTDLEPSWQQHNMR